MLQTLQRIKKRTDIGDFMLGILPTMYAKNTVISNEILQALKESYTDYVLQPAISYRVEVKIVQQQEQVLLIIKTVM